MIKDMMFAAEQDRVANTNKKPGINKLKLLPTVEAELKMYV